MGWDEYQRLLPQGSGFGRLIALVKNYIGSELMWDVNLILKRAQIPAAEIGRCAILGRSSWLSKDNPTHDVADLVLTHVRH